MDAQQTLTRPEPIVETQIKPGLSPEQNTDNDAFATEIIRDTDPYLGRTLPHFVLPVSPHYGDTRDLSRTHRAFDTTIPDALPFQPERPSSDPEFTEFVLAVDSQDAVVKPMRQLNPFFTRVDESGHTVMMTAIPGEPDAVPEIDTVLASVDYQMREVETYLQKNLPHGSFTFYGPEPVTLHNGSDVFRILQEKVTALSGGEDIDTLILDVGRIAPVQQLEYRIPDAVSMVLRTKDGTHLARLLLMPDVEYPDPTQKEPQVFLGMVAEQIGQVLHLGVPELSRLGLTAKEQELLQEFPLEEFSPIFRLEYDVRSNVLVINDQFFRDIGASFTEHPQGRWVNAFSYALRSFESYAPAVNAQRIEEAKEDALERERFINNLQPIELPLPEDTEYSQGLSEIPTRLLQAFKQSFHDRCTVALQEFDVNVHQGDVISQLQTVFEQTRTQIEGIIQMNLPAREKVLQFQTVVGNVDNLNVNGRNAATYWSELEPTIVPLLDSLFVTFVERQLQGNSERVLADISVATQEELAFLVNQRVPMTERREHDIDGTPVDEDTLKQTIKFQFFHRLLGRAKNTHTRFIKEPTYPIPVEEVYTDALKFLGIQKEINARQMDGALNAAQAYQDLLNYKQRCIEEEIVPFKGLPYGFKTDYGPELLHVFKEAGISEEQIALYTKLTLQEEQYLYQQSENPVQDPTEVARHDRRVRALATFYKKMHDQVEEPIVERLQALENDLNRFRDDLEDRFREAGIPEEQIKDSLPDPDTLARILITAANECVDDIQTIHALYTDVVARLDALSLPTSELVYFQDPTERAARERIKAEQAQRLRLQKMYLELAERLYARATVATP